jgi:hypothetical protein
MIKKVLFFLFLAVVFSAVAVSASQLSKKPVSAAACGNPCGSSAQCARGCLCLMFFDGGEGMCVAPGNPAAPIH